MQSLDDILEEAKQDPTLFSSIDIDELLDKIEKEHYLENKCLTDISKDVFDAIDELDLEKEIALDYCTRLSGYRYVDKLCDLRNGRLLRWIKRTNKNLTNGGLLVNVKMDPKGVKLLCKNNMNKFFNVCFDDCLIFQKLTTEDQLILMANENTLA
jgi:hypothetical protein